MINIPFEVIVQKIKEKTNITDEEINNKIKQKMDQLSGLISKDGAIHIIANELGVKLVQSGDIKIKDIYSGMRSLDTKGKVIKKYETYEFQKGDIKGKVGSFLLGDETGAIRVTAWHKQTEHIEKMKEGDVIKIVGGYVKLNNNRPEIHINDKSRLIINPENITIGEVKTNTSSRKKISELAENDMNIEILGTIVQVFDIKFFEVCKNCRKRLVQKEGSLVCPEHGNIGIDYSYIMNAFVDDGTENIRVVFFRNQTQNLTKKSHDDLLVYRTMLQDFDKVKTELLGEAIKLIGKVQKNPMFDRIEFIANTVYRDINLDQEIKKLNEELAKA